MKGSSSKKQLTTQSYPVPRKGTFVKIFRKNYQFYLLILPALLFTFIFSYIPMYGAQIAFRDFNPGLGYLGSEWVWFKHFLRFFREPTFWRLIKNTVTLNLYLHIFTTSLELIFALMLNEVYNKHFKKTVQMITYMPHFISTVAMCGMILLFLHRETGVINLIGINLFGTEGYNFIADPHWFKSIYVISLAWQNLGWGSIIFVAALSGVSQEIVEAATIDGVNRFQKIWYVDLPTILPTLIILVVLQMGSLLSGGFDAILLLQNSLNLESSEVLATFVYKLGITNAQFSYSTAIGLFNSVINVIFLIIVNKAADRLTDTSLW